MYVTHSQSTIKESLIMITIRDPWGDKQKLYDQRLLEFLALNYIPVHVVNSTELKTHSIAGQNSKH